MTRTHRLAVVPLLLILLLVAADCAKAPPNLTPQAQAAFQKTRIIKALDVLRDTAIDANSQTPPLLPESTTRQVVQFHQSALTIIRATDDGWQTAVQTGLAELLKRLPARDAAVLAPYVALVSTLITEVAR